MRSMLNCFGPLRNPTLRLAAHAAHPLVTESGLANVPSNTIDRLIEDHLVSFGWSFC